MDSPCQPNLVDIPEQPLQQDRAPHGSVKLKSIDSRQTVLAQIYVEELIPAEHKARSIWDLVGRMDLNRFAETLRTTAGCAGRPAWDPQLMVSLWVYAYSEGISSARGRSSGSWSGSRGCNGWAGCRRSTTTACRISGSSIGPLWTNCLRSCWRCWRRRAWWTSSR